MLPKDLSKLIKKYVPSRTAYIVFRFSDLNIEILKSNNGIRRQTLYIENEEHGLYRLYTVYGITFEEMMHKRGLRTGYYKTYDENTGKLKSENIPIDGEKLIRGIQYHHNGKIKEERYFTKEGDNEGSYIKYFEDGAVAVKGQYANGKRVGHFEIFYMVPDQDYGLADPED